MCAHVCVHVCMHTCVCAHARIMILICLLYVFIQTISQTVRLVPDNVDGITVNVVADCPSGYDTFTFVVYNLYTV